MVPGSYPPTASASKLEDLTNTLVAQAYSQATLAGYVRRWKHFTEFRAGLGYDNQLPVSPQIVALYVTYLNSEGASLSSIRSAMSVVAWYHNIQGFQDPTKELILRN